MILCGSRRSFIEPRSTGVCVLCLWFLRSGSRRTSQRYRGSQAPDHDDPMTELHDFSFVHCDILLFGQYNLSQQCLVGGRNAHGIGNFFFSFFESHTYQHHQTAALSIIRNAMTSNIYLDIPPFLCGIQTSFEGITPDDKMELSREMRIELQRMPDPGDPTEMLDEYYNAWWTKSANWKNVPHHLVDVDVAFHAYAQKVSCIPVFRFPLSEPAPVRPGPQHTTSRTGSGSTS